MSLIATLRDIWSRLAAVGSIGTGFARRSLFDRISFSLYAGRKYGWRDAVTAWQLAPIAGGAPEDPEDDPDPDPDPDPEDDPEADPDPDDDPDPEDDPEDDPDDPEDDPEPLSKKERDELNRLKREAAERRKKDREAARKRQEKEGKHEQVVQGLQKEVDEEREGKENAEAALALYKRNVVVSKVARRLRFQDPDDAHAFLPDALPDDASEADIERALRDVVKTKSYLVKRGKRSGKTSSGGTDDDPSSANELDTLDDPDAIRAAVLKGNG